MEYLRVKNTPGFSELDKELLAEINEKDNQEK